MVRKRPERPKSTTYLLPSSPLPSPLLHPSTPPPPLLPMQAWCRERAGPWGSGSPKIFCTPLRPDPMCHGRGSCRVRHGRSPLHGRLEKFYDTTRIDHLVNMALSLRAPGRILLIDLLACFAPRAIRGAVSEWHNPGVRHRHTHRHRDTDTHTDTQTHTQTHTDTTQTDRHTDTHTHTHRHTQTHTDPHRHTQTHTDTHTDRDTDLNQNVRASMKIKGTAG